MKVVIIEDEPLTAEFLKESLLKLVPGIKVLQTLASVSGAVEFFNRAEHPDLIFCDIHLADGHSFEIFKHIPIKTPVVFITAYDQYALQAFKANGIDYILKPFKESDITGAIDKFTQFRNAGASDAPDYESLIKQVVSRSSAAAEPSSLLVKYRDKIKPVKIADVAFFITENKSLQLTTLTNDTYNVNKTLEDIEKICGNRFYRVNRQILVNRDAIDEVIQGYSRKLMIRLKIGCSPDLMLNKTKVTDFLTWLSA